MKKVFTFLLTIIFCGNVWGQCPPTTPSFYNQQDIDNFAASYPNCTELSGFVQISGSTIVSLEGLSNITVIQGNLYISGTSLTSLSGLDNLTFVENLEILGNSLMNISNLSMLNSVSQIYIMDNDELLSLEGLEGVTTLEYLSLEFNDKLTNMVGLNNLTSIDFASIWDNHGLVDFTGLENLVSVGSSLDIFGGQSLVSLTGLEGLQTAGDLSIFDTPSLISLNGLNNLTSIENNLTIVSNLSLTDMTGLSNLTEIGGQRFWVQDNPVLTNLAGLGNINHTTINELRIKNNENLFVCNIPGICAHLFNGGWSDISDNAAGCNNEQEVLSACNEFAKIISYTFYDLNQNKLQDANEPYYADATIGIEPGELVLFFEGNGDAFFVEPGTYTATYQSNNTVWALTTDSLSYHLNLTPGDTDTIYFGVYPTADISTIKTVINSPPARCNESIVFDISTKNTGTTTASGITWFTIDENITNVDFINLPDTTLIAFNTYGWYFTDLFPGQSITNQAALTIPGPPDFEVGGILNFIAYTDYTDINGSDTSEGFRYSPEVRCSYDPNDKLVNPAREGDYTLFDENLIYTIRFQNTGNDVAYDVVIRDTLDANLDLESFNVLGSSHADELQTTMSEAGILTFEFRDIFLPDSTSNLEGSQGYVTYLISAIDGLAENTPITNSAGIYFDLNPPILTNTTQSVMVSELPVVSTTHPDTTVDFTISPNPNTGIFQVNGIPQGTYQIHDTTGRIIQSGNMQNDLSIDISQEARGVYFISIQMENEVISKRIIKM